MLHQLRRPTEPIRSSFGLFAVSFQRLRLEIWQEGDPPKAQTGDWVRLRIETIFKTIQRTTPQS